MSDNDIREFEFEPTPEWQAMMREIDTWISSLPGESPSYLAIAREVEKFVRGMVLADRNCDGEKSYQRPGHHTWTSHYFLIASWSPLPAAKNRPSRAWRVAGSTRTGYRTDPWSDPGRAQPGRWREPR